jgi:hypothetical protein
MDPQPALEDGKRFVYIGVFRKYGLGSVAELDAHLAWLVTQLPLFAHSMVATEAISYDHERLTGLRATVAELERLADEEPLYVHDVIGEA